MQQGIVAAQMYTVREFAQTAEQYGAALHKVRQMGYTTVETKGNFSRPITKDAGRIRAEARVVAPGRQIISSEARVLAQDGRVLAHGISTIMVLGGLR